MPTGKWRAPWYVPHEWAQRANINALAPLGGTGTGWAAISGRGRRHQFIPGGGRRRTTFAHHIKDVEPSNIQLEIWDLYRCWLLPDFHPYHDITRCAWSGTKGVRIICQHVSGWDHHFRGWARRYSFAARVSDSRSRRLYGFHENQNWWRWDRYIVVEGWVSSRDFLLGLAIIQAFPGPNFNCKLSSSLLGFPRPLII